MHISDWLPTILSATQCEEPRSLDGLNHWVNLQSPQADIYYPRSELLHNIDPMLISDGTESRKFRSGEEWRKEIL